MAVTKPLFVNALDYDAESERRGFAGLLAQTSAGVPRTGVLGPEPEVSLSGSTVQVGPFNAAIGSAKGVYLVAVDSVTSAGTIGVANQTNDRLDRIVLEVLDPDNGTAGTERTARLRIVPGEAKALPGLPALPALALHIGQVSVPKASGGNPVLTVECQFTAAAGAPIPVRNKAERDALIPRHGLQVLRMDVEGSPVDSYDGSKWRDGGWDTGHQLIGNMGSSYSGGWRGFSGGGYGPLAFRRAGQMVQIWGAGASANPEGIASIILQMPVGFRPTTKVPGVNCEMNPDGALRTVVAYGTNQQPSFSVTYFAA